MGFGMTLREEPLHAPKGRGSVHFSRNTQLSWFTFGFSTLDRDMGRYRCRKYFLLFYSTASCIYVTSDLHPRDEDYGQLGCTHPSSPVQVQLGKAGVQNEWSEHLPIFLRDIRNLDFSVKSSGFFLSFFFFFFNFLAMLHGMWDLSSLNRNRTLQ